jgi:hypothetical protein
MDWYYVRLCGNKEVYRCKAANLQPHTQVNGQKAECEAEAAKIEGALVLYDGPMKRGLQDRCQWSWVNGSL